MYLEDRKYARGAAIDSRSWILHEAYGYRYKFSLPVCPEGSKMTRFLYLSIVGISTPTRLYQVSCLHQARV